jgi:hypothetical protein
MFCSDMAKHTVKKSALRVVRVEGSQEVFNKRLKLLMKVTHMTMLTVMMMSVMKEETSRKRRRRGKRDRERSPSAKKSMAPSSLGETPRKKAEKSESGNAHSRRTKSQRHNAGSGLDMIIDVDEEEHE